MAKDKDTGDVAETSGDTHDTPEQTTSKSNMAAEIEKIIGERTQAHAAKDGTPPKKDEKPAQESPTSDAKEDDPDVIELPGDDDDAQDADDTAEDPKKPAASEDTAPTEEPAPAQESAKEDDELPVLDLDEDIYGKDLVDALKTMSGKHATTIKRVMDEVRQVRQQVTEYMETVVKGQVTRLTNDYDEDIGGRGGVFKKAFGEGTMTSLDKDSTQARNRMKLFTKVIDLAKTRPEASAKELIDAAIRTHYPELHDKVVADRARREAMRSPTTGQFSPRYERNAKTSGNEGMSRDEMVAMLNRKINKR